MTDAPHWLQHGLRSPTRAGEAQSCGICVLSVWEKTRLPGSALKVKFPLESVGKRPT